MDESVVTNLAKALSDVTDILHKIAEPAAGEVGLLLRDKIRIYRLRNLAQTLPSVLKMLADEGIQPAPIPPRLCVPALEAASLEDNTTLQERWAALLANAANPKRWAPVLPAYVELLKQLSPEEASVLHGIHERVTLNETSFPDIGESGLSLGDLNVFDIFLRNPPPDIIKEDGSTNRRFILEITENLIRLGIIVRYQEPPGSWKMRATDEPEYYLTAFGYAFLRACHAPKSPASEKSQ